MKNSVFLRVLRLAGASFLFAFPLHAQESSPLSVPATCYLFAYWVGERDGIHLAWSEDGLKWRPFMDDNKEKIFLKPTVGKAKLLRDPCILLGPDQVFRMVWTSGSSQDIGYASSKDLLNWSEQQSLPVMKSEPKTLNCWAPEVHYDTASNKYLVFWSSTIPGRFPETDNTGDGNFNHRTYLTTTTDFVTYTPTVLWFDPKFSTIDTTLIPFKGKVYLILKNETLRPEAAKDLYLAPSDSMLGPYTQFTGPIATQPPHWIEGPTAIQIGDKVIIYYDCYHAGHFGACESTDLENWQDITPRLSLPRGIRHGTVIAVPGSVISNLLSALGNSSPTPASP